jgi:hypothetical protein
MSIPRGAAMIGAAPQEKTCPPFLGITLRTTFWERGFFLVFGAFHGFA